MSQHPNENGLDLFDETASAVRGFPNAMLGYDKRSVDEYLRDVERQLALAKHQVREVQRELTAANLRVDDTDFSKLGAHTASLLQVAEAQATDLLTKAQMRAQAIVAEARRQADTVRAEAAQTAEAARQQGLASLQGLRADLAAQTESELAAARAEAQALRDAADKHGVLIRTGAEHEAAALTSAAQAEADRIRTTAEREGADAHAAALKARDEALREIAQRHEAHTAELTGVLGGARAQADELATSLAEASATFRARQQAAYEEAERTKAAAVSEGAALIAKATADADEILRKADAALADRNEQLRRDNRMLRQRKQALLGQLNQLSSLATVTASEFPEDEATGPIPGGLEFDLDEELSTLKAKTVEGEASDGVEVGASDEAEGEASDNAEDTFDEELEEALEAADDEASPSEARHR